MKFRRTPGGPCNFVVLSSGQLAESVINKTMTFSSKSLVRSGRNSDLSRQVAVHLRARIERGEYRDRLPGVQQLARELEVSHQAVHSAVQRLCEEGIVYSVPRSGTYISPQVTNRTRRLAVLLGGIGGPVHSALLHGLSRRASELGQHILLGANLENTSKETLLRRVLAEDQVDGVLIWPSEDVEELKRMRGMLRRHRLPWVEVMDTDELTAQPEGSYVVNDDLGGAEEAVSYLVQSGRRRIAFVSMHIPGEEARSAADRFFCRRRRGYEQALTRSGLPVFPTISFAYQVAHGMGQGALDLSTLDRLDGFDALFCLHDGIAGDLLPALRGCGRRIPEDIAVIGFNDAELTGHLGLSTMAQPFEEIGARAVELLLDQISGQDVPPVGVVLPSRLVLRQST